jgi:small-conductance mechanosensitive channel
MLNVLELAGRGPALSLFGVRLVGLTAENGVKLLLTLGLILVLWLAGRALRRLARRLTRGRRDVIPTFWSNQAINIAVTILFFIGFLSIWFNDPTRLATALGLVSAGLAFALQRVVTSVAGYYIILRGRLFNVGDRISMGGVRGDVIRVQFIYTTVMEMGQPPAVQMADPAMWVEARQYTGRIVTVTNDKIFDTPLYNYSREFPYIWEEMQVMIGYSADRRRAEEILLDVARRHTVQIAELGQDVLQEMERRYFLHPSGLVPKVYFRLTSNWLELTVRFVCHTYDIRGLKDVMSRDIIAGFDQAGITIASTTFDIVGFPPVRIQTADRPAKLQ